MEIERIFEERKDEMRRKCPAYSLDCVIVEELERCLASVEGFSEYVEHLRIKTLQSCQLTYEYGKMLASSETGELVNVDEVSQETLMIQSPIDPRLNVSWTKLNNSKPADRQAFISMYLDIADDKADFEIMYASLFGFEAGGAGPKLLEQVRSIIDPGEDFDICWWPVVSKERFK